MKELQMGLSYESTPDNDRAVNTKQTPSNEVLLIAHIARPSPHLRLADRISICAGFAVAAGENDESPLVVSCTHTLNSMKSALSDTSTDTPSATLILTYDNGSITDIRSAESLESCLPLNDIVFYKPSATLFGKGQNLRTLPVNPYPPPPRAPVAVWLPPNTTMDAPEWTFGSIDRYTTPNAKLAQIGTYDHLANVEINDAIPRLGASGSPIIEIESGAVCAIVKGAISTYPKSRGWATPAERVWECFDLPGLKFRYNNNANEHKLRVVVRKLPANLPEEIFYSAVQTWVNSDTVSQSYYSKGKLRAAKENIASRAYITFKEYAQLLSFHAGFDGHLFKDKQGRESRASIEFAPYQRTPQPKQKQDQRQGTIEEDPDFKSFLELLETAPTKPDFEANLMASRAVDKPKQTPLLAHLAIRREKQKAKREKARAKSQRKAKEKSIANNGTPSTPGVPSEPSGSNTPKDKQKNANQRPKKTRGEKRAAKKVRDTEMQPEAQFKAPVTILSRPDGGATPSIPSSTPSPALNPPRDPPKGPRGGAKPRGGPPRGPRGRGSTAAKPGLETWYGTHLEERTIGDLKPNEVVLKVNAVGFNHRDKWIRQGLYPGIKEGVTMGSDAAGVIIADGDDKDTFVGKRYFVNPSRGWIENKKHSEEPFIILGGCDNAEGVFATAVKVDKKYILPTPEHLTDEQAAAWPLAAVTAWRATFVKAQVEKGIGGGVALQALQFAVAKGANVYVTSGNSEKLQRAIKQFGAAGGVNYKDADWPEQLEKQLPSDHVYLDAVIDSSGGDIVTKVNNLLQPGSPIAIYGMTSVPKTQFTMGDVIKNFELKGSTMGSLKELQEATAFISQHKLIPVVDQPVIQGLENAEEGFQRLVKSSQMGSVVISVGGESKL
ncbi:NAD(P)-binding protein [Wallemia mellicola]|nr:NAD(P)-binding protein [Wallemia mellicola]TIB92496.1 NAD(P)-binding protein [Wallemia mellicola]TIC43328.1 NAD(P)-binding protein [Wallemia mellicola]TIC52352.1 NAD(P)-binding protein [Wallemia mellicola]